jgi:hypothetical protein
MMNKKLQILVGIAIIVADFLLFFFLMFAELSLPFEVSWIFVFSFIFKFSGLVLIANAGKAYFLAVKLWITTIFLSPVLFAGAIYLLNHSGIYGYRISLMLNYVLVSWTLGFILTLPHFVLLAMAIGFVLKRNYSRKKAIILLITVAAILIAITFPIILILFDIKPIFNLRLVHPSKAFGNLSLYITYYVVLAASTILFYKIKKPSS